MSSSTTASNVTTSTSTTDLQERIQWLVQHERARYTCPDYAAASNYTACGEGAPGWRERLEHIMNIRRQSLLELYNAGIPTTFLSTATFIFDRYLSTFTFIPQYVRGECTFPFEGKCNLIALASFFIAAKSLAASCERKMPNVVRQFKYSQEVFAKDVESTILEALDWNIVYMPPISIIRDLLTIISLPCGYQEHDKAFSAFKDTIVQEAKRITKVTTVYYGFNVKYPPSIMALAALSIALEIQPSSKAIPVFGLVSPTIYITLEMQKNGIDLSFDDADVVKCRQDMLQLIFSRKGKKLPNNKDTSVSAMKRPLADSPTTVAEVHKRRRTTKKRNSFAAKTA